MISEKDIFEPIKLRKSLENVKSLHTHEYFGKKIISESDSALKDLIKRLTSLKKKELKKEAILLETYELVMMTQYIPHNYYSVDMSNLYELFKFSVTENLSATLYLEWQDVYDNPSCNEFISDLCQNNTIFQKKCRELGIEPGVYHRFLQAENVPIEICSYLKEAGIMEDSLEKSLHKIHIDDNTGIYAGCEYCFYMYCLANNYLALNAQQLKSVVIKYSSNISHIKAFVKNFLECMSNEYLRQYDDILPSITKSTGENRSAKFNDFFKGFSDVLVQRFIDWVNDNLIDIYLDTTRGIFWKRYKFDKVDITFVKEYDYELVIFENEKYVVTEFLDGGYAYFFERDVFFNDVRKRFWRMNKKEVHSFLFNCNLELAKLSHPPGWQYKFAFFIDVNDIAETRKYN